MASTGRGPRERESTRDEAAGDSSSPATRAVLAAGVVVAAAGLVVAFGPGIPALLRALQWWHVTAAAMVALIGAAATVRGRLHTPVRAAETGDPESVVAVPTPGVDVDELVEGFRRHSDLLSERSDVRRRLEDAAVDVLVRIDDITEERAHELVASGEWTDDAEAAAFLDEYYVEPAVPRRTQLRRALAPESKFQRRVRHVVQAIADGAGFDAASVPQTATPTDADRGDHTVRRGERGAAVSDGNGTPGGTFGGPHPTYRWVGVSALGLAGIGAGVLFRQPGALMAGVVGLGFAGYASAGASSLDAVELSVERSIDDRTPAPGEEVSVRVTVRNEGETLLPDLRLVDGVPGSLAVTAGSPRLGVGLRPGKAATFSYTVVARPGTHRFDPLTVVARDVTGAVEREVTAESETELVCLPVLRASAPVPLARSTAGYAGRVDTPAGGAGTEFHSTREYRRGDPVSRVDWNRLARTSDLTTVEFREESIATVVLVLDARAVAYRAPGAANAHAVGCSVEAAAGVAAGLLDAGNRVGVAVASPAGEWLSPGAGHEHRAQLRRFLARDDVVSPVPPTATFSPVQWVRRLRRRLPDDAQVVFLSPLADDTAALLARWLDGYGYPVTVVSPDPTDNRTTGQLLARVERVGRVAGLRERGLRVVDWAWEEPLDAALRRATARRRG